MAVRVANDDVVAPLDEFLGSRDTDRGVLRDFFNKGDLLPERGLHPQTALMHRLSPAAVILGVKVEHGDLWRGFQVKPSAATAAALVNPTAAAKPINKLERICCSPLRRTVVTGQYITHYEFRGRSLFHA